MTALCPRFACRAEMTIGKYMAWCQACKFTRLPMPSETITTAAPPAPTAGSTP